MRSLHPAKSGMAARTGRRRATALRNNARPGRDLLKLMGQPPDAPPRLRDILGQSADYLARKQIDSPRLSAELILAHALGIQRLGLYLDLDRPLLEHDLAKIRPLLARRGIGEPVAYILGRKEFYGLEFAVTPDVLIPRPETELGVDLVRGLASADTPWTLADVGTGSGALAVALLVHLPRSRCLAVDLSAEALAIARKNSAAHQVIDRVSFVRADLLTPVRSCSLDLIVANPPYLGEAELAAISREVADFEPRRALVAGPRGDELFASLATQAMRVLRPGGYLLMEVGHTQADSVARTVAGMSGGWTAISRHKDFAGVNRYVQARWTGQQKAHSNGA